MIPRGTMDPNTRNRQQADPGSPGKKERKPQPGSMKDGPYIPPAQPDEEGEVGEHKRRTFYSGLNLLGSGS
jgi:hypothetical protein